MSSEKRPVCSDDINEVAVVLVRVILVLTLLLDEEDDDAIA